MCTDMRGLGQGDDNVIDAENWREVGSIYGDDMEEGLGFEDIIGFFKSKKGKEEKDEKDEKDKKDEKDEKDKKDEKHNINHITIIWRGINWFIVCTIVFKLITFSFKELPFAVFPYLAPEIPWAEAAKMIFFFIALNIAFNASAETDKDKIRLIAAIELSAIPTCFLIGAGEMGLFNLFIAGCISFSAYREKIYTDANVRRTPPKKHRKDYKRGKDGRLSWIDEYDV